MKVLIYTAMYERHVVSEMWCIGMKRFIAAAPVGVQCTVVAVITHSESEDICSKYGVKVVYENNSPLGNKFNKGLLWAFENVAFDYMLLMGDDDVVSSEAWNYYLPMMQQRVPYFGFNKLYFYSPKLRKAVQFEYSKSFADNKLIGCGRMFERFALERTACVQDVRILQQHKAGGACYNVNEVVTMPLYRAWYFIKMRRAVRVGEYYFGLWRSTQQKSLDDESELRMLMNGYCPVAIATDKPMLLDVKTDKNIWDYKYYSSIGKEVSEDDALRVMGNEERLFLERHLR